MIRKMSPEDSTACEPVHEGPTVQTVPAHLSFINEDDRYIVPVLRDFFRIFVDVRHFQVERMGRPDLFNFRYGDLAKMTAFSGIDFYCFHPTPVSFFVTRLNFMKPMNPTAINTAAISCASESPAMNRGFSLMNSTRNRAVPAMTR